MEKKNTFKAALILSAKSFSVFPSVIFQTFLRTDILLELELFILKNTI